MTDKPFSLQLIIILTVVTLNAGMAYPETQQTPAVPLPPITKLQENIFQVGAITINKKERFASIKGEINMSDGPVEYLACTPNGKLHESVLSLQVEPYHIQVALLLLGLVPGDSPIEFQGAPEPPCGDPVRIVISWEENGKPKAYSPEHLVTQFRTDKIMEETDWVFTGSQIMDGRYMAQAEGSIAAIFHDPFAIFDHRSLAGADDTLFQANKKVLPPVGTPVIFKIFSQTDPDVKKRTRCENTGN